MKIKSKFLNIFFFIAGVSALIPVSIILSQEAVQSKLIAGLDSDLLYPEALFKDLGENIYSLKDWVLPPGTYFFPDLFIYFILKILLLDISYILSVYVFLQIILIVFLVLFASEFNFEKIHFTERFFYSSVIVSFYFLLLNFLNLEISSFFLPAFHGYVSVSILLLIAFLNSNKKMLLIPLTLLAMSDGHFYINIFFPLLILFLLNVLSKKAGYNYLYAENKSILYIIAVSISASFGMKILTNSNFLNIPSVPALSLLKTIIFKKLLFMNFHTGIKEFIVYLEQTHYHLLYILTAVLFFIFYLYRKSNPSNKLYLSYLSITIVSPFMVQFFFGTWMGTRYIWSIFLIPLFLFIEYLTPKYNSRLVKTICIGAYLFVLFYLGFISHRGFRFEKTVYPSRIACIDSITKNGSRGLSDYWHVKHTNYFTKNNLELFSMHPDLEPYIWIDNKKRYDKLLTEKVDFIIVNGLNREAILQKYGNPISVKYCESDEIFIY